MTRVAMCDVCTEVIERDTDYNRAVNGQGRLQCDIKGRTYDVTFQFVSSSGDRIDIDLCPKCLAAGGVGLGGKEKNDGEDGTNDDRYVLQDD